MQISKWLLREPKGDVKKCVLLLPGRGVPAQAMLQIANHMGLTKYLRLAVEPKHRAWYPMPRGANDQEHALQGLDYANHAVRKVIQVIEKGYNIKKSDIALLGFSAGAVVALDVAINSDEPFACCVSMSGAILNPAGVRPAVNDTPIVLQHNLYDDVFSWDERYVPTRDALINNNYQVVKVERQGGQHTIYREDITTLSKVIRTIFNDKQPAKPKLQPKQGENHDQAEHSGSRTDHPINSTDAVQ